MLKNAVFLDRDGVINRDSADYIKSLEEFEFLPGSLEGLALLTKSGCTLIVVTNQSALNRRLISREALDAIHDRLVEAAAARGARIRDILFCPHLPEENCACRKPKPGMLLEARRRHNVDFSSAVMIGDSVKDMDCAVNAGVGTRILVRTGNGAEAEQKLEAQGRRPDRVAQDLCDAARWLEGRWAAQGGRGSAVP
jgi:D-glycero-D-manno-heptose 1,7-bisphosphate phosphatase